MYTHVKIWAGSTHAYAHDCQLTYAFVSRRTSCSHTYTHSTLVWTQPVLRLNMIICDMSASACTCTYTVPVLLWCFKLSQQSVIIALFNKCLVSLLRYLFYSIYWAGVSPWVCFFTLLLLYSNGWCDDIGFIFLEVLTQELKCSRHSDVWLKTKMFSLHASWVSWGLQSCGFDTIDHAPIDSYIIGSSAVQWVLLNDVPDSTVGSVLPDVL